MIRFLGELIRKINETLRIMNNGHDIVFSPKKQNGIAITFEKEFTANDH